LRRWYLLGAPEALEDLRRPATPQLICETNPRQLGIVLVDRMLAANDLPAMDIGDEAEQRELPIRFLRKRTDRHLAPSFECGEKRALGAHLESRLGVVEGKEQATHAIVILANLDGNRTLAGRGQPLRCVQV
jgi:hypothetical protein